VAGALTPRREGETWTVSVDPDWPGFAGHFPDHPLLPAAALIAMATHCAEELGHPTDRIVKARFTAEVGPGERLTWSATRRAGGVTLSAEGHAGTACTVQFGDQP